MASLGTTTSISLAASSPSWRAAAAIAALALGNLALDASLGCIAFGTAGSIVYAGSFLQDFLTTSGKNGLQRFNAVVSGLEKDPSPRTRLFELGDRYFACVRLGISPQTWDDAIAACAMQHDHAPLPWLHEIRDLIPGASRSPRTSPSRFRLAIAGFSRKDDL